MKTKHIILTLLFLSMSYTAEAQFFKKLKKKAQEAAEKTILKKTDEVVTKKTEQVIDSSTTSNPSKKNKEKEGAMQQKMSKMFGGGLDAVPDTYKFSYLCTMKINTGKKETDMKYWLEPNKAYFGNSMTDGKQNNITVMDMKNKLMVLFSDNGEQKTAMNLPMNSGMMDKYTKKLNQKADVKNSDVKITSIPSKTILGYFCKGFQITSKEGVTRIWVTDETPVGFLGGISGMGKAANSILPLGENTMLMEMNHTSNKDKEGAFSMVCTDIKQQNLVINKSEYKAQGFSNN